MTDYNNPTQEMIDARGAGGFSTDVDYFQQQKLQEAIREFADRHGIELVEEEE